MEIVTPVLGFLPTLGVPKYLASDLATICKANSLIVAKVALGSDTMLKPLFPSKPAFSTNDLEILNWALPRY